MHGLCTYDGRLVIPCENNFLDWADDSLLILTRNNNSALYNTRGNQLTDFKYMLIGHFQEGRAKVRVANQFGFIDKSGKEVIPPAFNGVSIFSEGRAVVNTFSGHASVIDTSGKPAFGDEYFQIMLLSDGIFSVSKQGKWGLMDAHGKTIVSFDFDDKLREYKGAIALQKNGKWQLFNKTNMQMQGPFYDEILITEGNENDIWWDLPQKRLSRSIMLVKAAEKWGLVGEDGKMLTPLQYTKEEAYRQLNVYRKGH